MKYLTILPALALLSLSLAPGAGASSSDRETHEIRRPFTEVVAALRKAVEDHRMVLVCEADAQKGAAARGVTIPGNRVLMVFRNDFAVRLLAADPAAGFEAPIRIYVHERADGATHVSYRTPTAVLAPYPHPEVQAVAAALDPIFRAIVAEALAAGSASPGPAPARRP